MANDRTGNRLKSTVLSQRGALVQVFRGLPSAADVPVALTIGNFDGVHRGHQAMLCRLVEAADDLALPAAVLTFDPPPREFFAKSTAPAAVVVAARQDRAVRRARRRAHVRRALRRAARVAGAGSVHRRRCSFAGSARAGCWWARISASARAAPATSRRCAARRGRSAWKRCAPWRSKASARRRRPCARRWRDGDLAHAGALLGRPFSISGRVAHGAKLGRSLGFPTANLPLKRKPPVAGIFAVRVHGLGGAPRDRRGQRRRAADGVGIGRADARGVHVRLR